MESIVREALYVYEVDIDSVDTRRFTYRGRHYRWFVRDSHVGMTRIDMDGSLHLTYWHDQTPTSLWPKLNLYLQTQGYGL